MNTRLEYLYRDGENYKLFHEVVIAGKVTISQLEPFYYEGDFFVPTEVGLEDLQEPPYRDCDHVWHQLLSAEATDEDPTVDVRSDELVERFKAAAESRWETVGVFRRMREFA